MSAPLPSSMLLRVGAPELMLLPAAPAGEQEPLCPFSTESKVQVSPRHQGVLKLGKAITKTLE